MDLPQPLFHLQARAYSDDRFISPPSSSLYPRSLSPPTQSLSSENVLVSPDFLVEFPIIAIFPPQKPARVLQSPFLRPHLRPSPSYPPTYRSRLWNMPP